ncbi:MAG: hypothetical protein HRU15_01195 [Planctomycetes bacterium]|nr:hypothetical protein [Planctomycetota bacterium]
MNVFHLMINEARRKPMSSILIACLSFCSALGLAFIVVLSVNAQNWSQELLGLQNNALQLSVLGPEATHIFGVGISKPRFKESDITWLKNDPDISAVHIIHAVPIPATIHIKIPNIADNKQLVTIIGLEPEIFSAADDQIIQKLWHCADDSVAQKSQQPIPIVINPAVVRLYNLGMADRYNLPRMNENFVKGVNFDMAWGADIFKKEANAFYGKVKVVGYSEAISPWDVAVPNTYAEQLIEHFFPQERPESAGIMKVQVIARSAEILDDLKSRIEKRGLRIPNNDPLIGIIRSLHDASSFFIAALVGIVSIVTLLALSSIISMICSERKRYIALYRQMGASLSHLICIFSGAIACSLCSAVLLACLVVRFASGPLLSPHLHELNLNPTVFIPATLEISAICISLLLFLVSCFTLWRMKGMDMLELLRDEGR